MSIAELLTSHKTFFTKRWQSNGYYPIDKYEWNENAQVYYCSPFKTKTPYDTEPKEGFLEYMLTHNAFFVSMEEFFNYRSYDNEGKTLIDTSKS